MAKESTFGPMVRHTMGNGYKHARTALAHGLVSKKIATLASGRTTKYGATEFINGQMETSMKESGQHLSKMGLELTLLQTKMSTLASIKTENQKGKDSTSGSLAQYTTENSNKAASTAKEHGKNQKQTRKAISTKVNTSMTKSTGKDTLSGRVETITLEATTTT